jgi:hypothetical protein
LARQIAQAASENAHSKTAATPFAGVSLALLLACCSCFCERSRLYALLQLLRCEQEARRARYPWQGGKPDDITVSAAEYCLGIADACAHVCVRLALVIAVATWQVIVCTVKGISS